MTTTFARLGVPEPICAALAQRGITEPFEIQAATIEDALAGNDVCGRAPTGSGKTLAFGVPLVALASRAEPRHPTSLVLAPTRELADQIASELRTFAGRTRVDVVYGGVGYGTQRSSLRRGVDVLIACPGRLEDLIQSGDVDLRAVERVVIDEADRMADMGFLPSVRRILDQTSPSRQTLLFSATLDGDVAELTRRYQRDPIRHEVGEDTPDVTAATHHFWIVDRSERSGVVAETINAAWPAIVFCRTRHGADRLKKQLSRAGVVAAAIHGGRSQSQRTRALAEFTAGRAQALVATDVAARGIHVDEVASVIHYDPPGDHKDYVHRSGRTARAGRGGVVVSLVQAEQVKDVRRLQRDVGLDHEIIEPDTARLRVDSVVESVAPPASSPAPAPSPGPRNRRDRSGKAKRDRRPTGPARNGRGTRGTVKYFDNRKGFGFISRKGGADLFVHYSNIAGDGYRSLQQGQRVEFRVAPGRRGDEARDVQPV